MRRLGVRKVRSCEARLQEPKPGYYCRVVFTGCVVVVPDVGALRAPGDRTEGVKSSKGDRAGTQTEGGLRGLKALGARDLTYKMCFIASSVQVGFTILLLGEGSFDLLVLFVEIAKEYI